MGDISELKQFLYKNPWIGEVLTDQAVVLPRDKGKVPYLVDGICCETSYAINTKIEAERLYDFVLKLQPLPDLAKQQVRKIQDFIADIENLNSQKREIEEKIHLKYVEIEIFGLNTRALSRVIEERSKKSKKQQEDDDQVNLYKQALGMV